MRIRRNSVMAVPPIAAAGAPRREQDGEGEEQAVQDQYDANCGMPKSPWS
jgi:hypothetical protein